jgi:hypothetical protein
MGAFDVPHVNDHAGCRMAGVLDEPQTLMQVTHSARDRSDLHEQIDPRPGLKGAHVRAALLETRSICVLWINRGPVRTGEAASAICGRGPSSRDAF